MIARTDQPNPLDRETWRRIRRKAKQLLGKAGFRQADREDIEQELALRVWGGLRNFDPEVGCSGAFVATVLERAANSLLRLRNSHKRGNGHGHRPLTIEYEDPEEGAAGDETALVLCSTEPSHESIFDLTHDVTVVLDQLPPRLRELAEELKQRSVTEIARRTDVSRSTIYAQIKQLRAAFAGADRKIFSQSSGASRALCEVNK